MAQRARAMLAWGWPLLALALVVRVAQIIATPDWTPTSDPEDYVRHAASIAHGHGFPQSLLPQGGPTALRPPLYPYFLGAVFAVSGDSETAGRLAAAVLGAVTVALIGLIADRLWDRRVARVSMLIAAVYPPLVLVSGTLISEALALPLLLGVILLLLERPATLRTAVAVGVLLGLGLLTRPALSVLALPIAIALWGRPWRTPRALVLPAAAGVAAALLIVPWTIRNATEFDALVPISTQSGYLLGGTYNEVSDHAAIAPGAYRPASLVPSFKPVLENRSLDENEVNKKLGEAGREYAKDHPGYIPRVIFWNGLRVLSLDDGPSTNRAAYSFQGIGSGWANLATVAWYLLALLAVAGLAMGVWRGTPGWLWLTPVLLFLSVIWISGDVRYRLPIEPFVIWAAAHAVARITDRRRAPRPQPTR